MPSRSQESRPYLGRQRSNSVPTLGLVNVSDDEASMLFSAAERATARRKRPVSVDSPGPVIEAAYKQEQLPERTFNFSTPSRHGFGKSPLRHVQRSASVSTLASDPTITSTSSPGSDPEDMEPTPLASQFPSSVRSPGPQALPTSPLSPRRVAPNPVLKAYADGIFNFTQTRLNSAAPETLKTLGLRRDPSLPATPELDVNEIPTPQRPVFRSQFSDWSSTRASSVFEPSSPSSPAEPRTPDDQTALMTPDSFFAEVTPRVSQTAQWAASLSSARASSNLGGDTFFIDSPTMGTTLSRQRTDSVTSSEAFSYFAGFDGATEAAGTRLSHDLSPIARQYRLQTSTRMPRSTPTSSVSNHPPYTLYQQAHSPYAEMASLSRTPSWQVPAVG